jgi:predicted nucleotide-binding protein (sugar kinase/HSP70/actin superfamily)
MYNRDHPSSSKNILSTTRKFTSNFPTTVESGVSAGDSFSIEIVDVKGEEVYQSAALTVVEGSEDSTCIENSYKTDTKATFEEPVEKTIEGLDNCEKIIYEEKSFYDDLEVTSNLLTTFKEGWENTERKETFTVEVDEGVSYKWFHLETPAFYRFYLCKREH